jgi:hypothetical protein
MEAEQRDEQQVCVFYYGGGHQGLGVGWWCTEWLFVVEVLQPASIRLCMVTDDDSSA